MRVRAQRFRVKLGASVELYPYCGGVVRAQRFRVKLGARATQGIRLLPPT